MDQDQPDPAPISSTEKESERLEQLLIQRLQREEQLETDNHLAQFAEQLDEVQRKKYFYLLQYSNG
jgi:hypothetical protein